MHGHVDVPEGRSKAKVARSSAGSPGYLAGRLADLMDVSEGHDVPSEQGKRSGSVVVAIDWMLVTSTIQVDSAASRDGIVIWDIL